MRVRGLGAAIAALALTAVATQASAAVITRTFTFNAFDFEIGSPIDPVTGKATVTFDPSLTTGDTTTGISMNASIPFGTPAWSFDAGSHTLFVGGEGCGGAASVCAGVDDFELQIFDPSGSFNLGDTVFPAFAAYGSSSFPSQTYEASDGIVTMSGVPEPSSWGLMILGFGLLGATARLRRAKAALAV